MANTMQAQTLLPAQIEGFADYERLRERVYESHASYEQFLQEVLHAEEDAANAGRVEPGTAQAIGAGLMLTGRYRLAAKYIGRGPENALAQFLRGRCERDAHRFDAAVDLFNQAAETGADRAMCNLEIVETLLEAQRLEEARKTLEAIPDDKAYRHVRLYLAGVVQAQDGFYEEAIESLEASVEIAPHYHKALFKLAYLLDLYGDDERALEAYRNCTATPPVHINALINLAALHKDMGQLDEAERCVQSVLDTDPNHERAKLFLKDIRSSRSMLYDEDQERLLETRNALLDIPISEFELSVRSRNCLKRMQIDTLGDLLRTTEAELLAYKNFGETSLNEIKNMLSQKGLRLGQMAHEARVLVGAEVEELEQHAGYVPPGSLAVLNKPVSEIELSVRSRKCLQRLGIVTLGELASRTEAELLGAKNFGVTSLNEIKQRLAEHGLSLRRLED
ncbi:MAG: tetratricopeptide repeat protein [Phycisphaerales bacterium]|nr:MAG: tetratricopeptide repeat protein [Phycisphaerales bacterium]